MSKKEKDIEAQDTQLPSSTDNVQGADNENKVATAVGSSANPKVAEAANADVDDESAVNTNNNSQYPNDVQQGTDEEQTDEQVENDFDEVHSLHSLYFEPSESRTTNIPPRLPMGYSYTLFNADKTKDKSDKQSKAQAPLSHPDLPTQDAVAQNERVKNNRSKRYRQQHQHKKWMAMKRWTKRYWMGLLMVAIVIAIAGTYNVWMPIVSHWQLQQHKDETPVVAADTMPVPVKTEVDTMANVLSHEDSLRIQDSVRHARWLYWKKYKQAKEASKDAEENAEETGTTNNATNASAASTGEHVPVHANDSTHH